jgi:hypothetical protein
MRSETTDETAAARAFAAAVELAKELLLGGFVVHRQVFVRLYISKRGKGPPLHIATHIGVARMQYFAHEIRVMEVSTPLYLQSIKGLIGENDSRKGENQAAPFKRGERDNAFSFIPFQNDFELLPARLALERRNAGGIESVAHRL